MGTINKGHVSVHTLIANAHLFLNSFAFILPKKRLKRDGDREADLGLYSTLLSIRFCEGSSCLCRLRADAGAPVLVPSLLVK